MTAANDTATVAVDTPELLVAESANWNLQHTKRFASMVVDGVQFKTMQQARKLFYGYLDYIGIYKDLAKAQHVVLGFIAVRGLNVEDMDKNPNSDDGKEMELFKDVAKRMIESKERGQESDDDSESLGSHDTSDDDGDDDAIE